MEGLMLTGRTSMTGQHGYKNQDTSTNVSWIYCRKINEAGRRQVGKTVSFEAS
jgi:hypothetical protein